MSSNGLTDGERLIVLETKLDAVIKSQKEQSASLKTFTDKVDVLLPTYATKSEVDTKIDNLRKAHTLQTWLVGTLSAAFGVILTVLIQNYFK
jgi:hypothetical protein